MFVKQNKYIKKKKKKKKKFLKIILLIEGWNSYDKE